VQVIGKQFDKNILRTVHTWFFGIINAVMLMIGGVELNPGLQMEEKLIDFMVEQREWMKGTRGWLEKNKSSLDTMSVKMDTMGDTMKILI
jgi:hypothetical protein